MDLTSSAQWVVREATRSDVGTIARHNAAMAWETENIRLEPDVVSAGTTRVVEEPALGFYLIAENEGAIAGQLMVTFEWSDWRNGCFWWIQSVYVVPSARRQGVFRALFRHLEGMAEQRGGVCGFRLYVEKDNRVAAAVYETLGLRESVYRIREIDLVLRHADGGPPSE